MEIIVSPRNQNMTAEYIEYLCDQFETPTNVSKESVNDIAKIDTIILNGLHIFTSDGHRYLTFYDENIYTPEMALEALRGIVAIQDPRGVLCRAKDPTDAEYGVSPDHDPFHDGYTYLWYCGKQEIDGLES